MVRCCKLMHLTILSSNQACRMFACLDSASNNVCKQMCGVAHGMQHLCVAAFD